MNEIKKMYYSHSDLGSYLSPTRSLKLKRVYVQKYRVRNYLGLAYIKSLNSLLKCSLSG